MLFHVEFVKIKFKKLHRTYQLDRDVLVASDKMHLMDDVWVAEVVSSVDAAAGHKSADIDTVHNRVVVASAANLMKTTGFHVDLINQ